MPCPGLERRTFKQRPEGAEEGIPRSGTDGGCEKPMVCRKTCGSVEFDGEVWRDFGMSKNELDLEATLFR
eukprot:2033568-Pyramimonas_sp.AAC.1